MQAQIQCKGDFQKKNKATELKQILSEISKIDDLIKAAVLKLGENIQVGRFERIELGK